MNNQTLKSKDNCNKILSELDRVKDAVNGYIKELDEAGEYIVYQSVNRGLIKHRVIVLKHTLT